MKTFYSVLTNCQKEKANGLTVDENKNNKCCAKTIYKHFVEA